MRILRINDTEVQIDEQTVIGVDYQSYDVKEPGKNFINITNSFSIPKTSANLAIFGNAHDPQSTSIDIYNQAICDYWINNDQIITNAKVRCDSIDNRINLFIYEKKDIWDELKAVKWPSFLDDFILWMQTENGLYSVGTPFTGTFNNFISEFAANTEGIILPNFLGALYSFEKTEPNTHAEGIGSIYLNLYLQATGDQPLIDTQGGHFCIFAKTIFEYIEYKYGVDFLTDGNAMPGNIWNDAIAPTIFVEAKEIQIIPSGTSGACSIYIKASGTNTKFYPGMDNSVRDKADKTLYDFCNAFFQHFNCIKDEFEINGIHTIRLARFDDLNTLADIVDWSGKLSGDIVFKPSFEKYAQNNIIRFKSVYEKGDTNLNSKTLTSNNKNLDYKTELFQIGAYIPSIVVAYGLSALDLSTKETFKDFTFMVTDGDSENDSLILYLDSNLTTLSTYVMLKKAALYSLNSEYTLLDSIIKYPKYYEVNKWLSVSDVRNFEFFKLYFFSELNGAFFVNKISGFNPELANVATKLELVKISNKAPVFPYITIEPEQYWVDGISDEFTDGENDLLY